MKRRDSIPFAIGFVLLILLLVPALAATESMVQGTVMGTGGGRLFVVTTNGESWEFAVSSSTHITRDGKLAPLDELRVRDRVSVASSKTGNIHVASVISARSPI